MMRALALLGLAALALGALVVNLGIGAKAIPPGDVLAALLRFDDENFDHFIVLFQRLPRALIAMFVGGLMAVCGAVLQGVMRNPLASPSLLGVNSGAVFFVVAFGFYLGVDMRWHGALAFMGGWFGFLCCLGLARMAGVANDPRGLGLILAGAIASMALGAMAQALLLADMNLRMNLLSWAAGNINHAYADRLYAIWPAGLVCLGLLMLLARPLTLVMLGPEKAASAGVPVRAVTGAALLASVGGAAAGVSICGPMGFVGLVVPHMVRPLMGAHFLWLLPGCVALGAVIALAADVIARTIFSPYVLHTGIVLELVGGLVFLAIVKRHYLSRARGLA